MKKQYKLGIVSILLISISSANAMENQNLNNQIDELAKQYNECVELLSNPEITDDKRDKIEWNIKASCDLAIYNGIKVPDKCFPRSGKNYLKPLTAEDIENTKKQSSKPKRNVKQFTNDWLESDDEYESEDETDMSQFIRNSIMKSSK